MYMIDTGIRFSHEEFGHIDGSPGRRAQPGFSVMGMVPTLQRLWQVSAMEPVQIAMKACQCCNDLESVLTEQRRWSG